MAQAMAALYEEPLTDAQIEAMLRSLARVPYRPAAQAELALEVLEPDA